MGRHVAAVVALLLLAAAAPAAAVDDGGQARSLDRSPEPAGVDTDPTPARPHEHRPRPPTPAGAVAHAGDHDGGSATGPSVALAYTYRRLPERRGRVEVTMRVPATPAVERVEFALPRTATVVETEGVVRNDSRYAWTGADAATIVYTLSVRVSNVGNARASWALLEHAPTTVRSETPVDTTETVTVAGPGYVGNGTVLLGAHEVYRRQVGEQTINLVVPGESSLRYGPEATIGALADASRSLRVGARDEVVHAFATPEIRTEARTFDLQAFEYDGDTLLLETDVELAAWVHEYVHTRQTFAGTERLRWLTEGSARYYEWLLSVKAGYAPWDRLGDVFARAATDDSVLAQPPTWNGDSAYRKGALVLASIDRRIRAATDGDRTLQAVLRRLNERRGPATLETFVRVVRDVGGPDAAAAARRYVTTAAVPEFEATAETFEAVYGYAGPELRRQVVGLSAATDNRTRRIDVRATRVPLALSETLRLTGQVDNVGDAAGLAAVNPRLRTGERVGTYFDTTWVGSVGSNESVTETATHRFDRPGTYEVTWADASYTVRVAPERGTASVVGLSVQPVADGAELAVRVTVRNDAGRATFARLPVAVDGSRASTVDVVLDGGETRTVTVRVAAPTSGSPTVSVRGATATATTPTTSRATATAATPTTSRATATAATPTTSRATAAAPESETSELRTTGERRPTTTEPGGGLGSYGPVVVAVVALWCVAERRRRGT